MFDLQVHVCDLRVYQAGHYPTQLTLKLWKADELETNVLNVPPFMFDFIVLAGPPHAIAVRNLPALLGHQHARLAVFSHDSTFRLSRDAGVG